MQNRYVHKLEFYLISGSAIQIVGLADHQRGAETLADNAAALVAEVEQARLLDFRQHIGQRLVITGREDVTGHLVADQLGSDVQSLAITGSPMAMPSSGTMAKPSQRLGTISASAC